jgi:hypothetical protein
MAIYYEDQDRNIVELNVSNCGNENGDGAPQDLPAHAGAIRPEKLIAARWAGASPLGTGPRGPPRNRKLPSLNCAAPGVCVV